MILLRHGQSEFNLHFGTTRRDPGVIDAPLTALGRKQAAEAARALAHLPIARIVTSPYTRALQTAAPVAAALGVPVVINPIVRERYAFACDVGTPRSELMRMWPQHDFSAIDEIWWPHVEEPEESIFARAASFRSEMATLPDWAETLVITHWGFILSLTGEKAMNGEWLRCDPTARPPKGVTWHA